MNIQSLYTYANIARKVGGMTALEYCNQLVYMGRDSIYGIVVVKSKDNYFLVIWENGSLQ